MNLPRNLSVIALLILTSTASHGALIFQIDQGTKLITASGSASGTTDNFWGTEGGVEWDDLFMGTTPTTSGSLNLGPIVTPFYSGSSPSISLPILNFTGLQIDFNAYIDFADEFTAAGFNAAGGTISYAGLTAAQQSLLEQMGASGFTITNGSFGTVIEPIAFTLVGAPIPEPSTYIAGAGFAALAGFMVYRRRKGKAVAVAVVA